MSDDRRAARFDRWADTYDEAVRRTTEYPFAGYEQLLDRVAAWAAPRPTDRVLDLGIGTGNLAGRLIDRVAEVWGTDLSSRMLDVARTRLPAARLVCADLLDRWPIELPDRFDTMVSGYVLHHFSDDVKACLLDRLASHLRPGGRMVIGDIAFATRSRMDVARSAWAESWDPDEFPWVADEISSRLGTNWAVEFEAISFCGGVFCLRPAAR